MATTRVIFRAMLEENGRPKLGNTAISLGIRKGRDIEVDANDLVHRPTFLPQGKNGVSCSPSIATLPYFALPVKHGGSNDKTEVWQISEVSLGQRLIAGQETSRHISIGPAASMTYDEYLHEIQATVSRWIKVDP